MKCNFKQLLRDAKIDFLDIDIGAWEKLEFLEELKFY